jgi:hypothetical protein
MEKPLPNPTAKLARIVCFSIMGFVTLLVLALYGVFFDKMSETELVQISFFWISLMGFGLGGLILAHKGIGWSMAVGAVIALAFFLALQTFYMTIWPSL